MDKKKKIDLLSELIQVKSVNGDEKDVAEILKRELDDAGIANEILPFGNNRANLVATLGHGHPVLTVSGHMDVVEVDKENWATDPFKLVEKDDMFYGRGVTDMKAGLAALVIAMIELKEVGTPLKGTIKLLATSGEEVGQLGAEKLTKERYAKDIDALLIAEPSGYRCVYANKGELNVTIDSKGQAAHSSMPKAGVNAVEHLLHVLNTIENKVKQATDGIENEVLGDTVFNIDVIHGGNQINAIPASAQAQINMRTIPEFTNDQLESIFKETIADYNQDTDAQIDYTVTMNTIAITGNKDSSLIRLIQKIGTPYLQNQGMSEEEIKQAKKSAELTGMKFSADEILTMGVSGGTDGSKFLINQPNGFDYTMFGPGNDTMHKDNESLSKPMYFDYIEMYKQLFSQYLK
ncbi:ArgE/DapE family deacylase [Tetragenococcus halophilus]|uniref:ArgE/DapE family deacylase n=1 Tax=Tetragenococcus halophilus TaxID=51669 RepID=UPI00077C4B4D|nr:ArgE/DapE family deacylase [Tetragenococcus halophilus]MCO8286258.1 ArgE/DapE family deacylase [Tetragenococcus halophilus]GMG64971.1 ArgE/DapE family deacylase [Tetragenococcus halophilus]